MVAVAVVAGGRRQVLFFIQRFGVDAALVIGELVAGNAERFHVVPAGMTFRAGLSHVGRINRGQRIAGRANAVHAVTTDAGRNARFILLFEQLSVDAGVILALLIDAQ
jgi:hypothetical protein